MELVKAKKPLDQLNSDLVLFSADIFYRIASLFAIRKIGVSILRLGTIMYDLKNPYMKESENFSSVVRLSIQFMILTSP